jgi:hypothetical protein
VEQLDFEAVRGRPGHLGDPVLLLEPDHQRAQQVVDHVDLVEAEAQRRGLLAGDEEQPALDVVPAPEVVTLVERDPRPLWCANVNGRTHKLVWFVPEEALDATRDAVFAAGAGRIGAYERCSWYSAGTGTFLPGEEADPAIGELGKEQRTPELRVETVVPAERAAEIVAALREAHPYEEVAFELYPLVELEQ